MEEPEWDAQAYGTIHSGSGVEETVTNGEGGEGGHCQIFQRLLVLPGDGDLLQIPRVGDIDYGRRLAGGGEEIGPVKDGVE